MIEWMRRRPRELALRDAGLLAGALASVWLLVIYWPGMVTLLGNDGFVYWSVDPADPYRDSTVGGANAYLYSPAFTLAFTPFRLLPREAFFAVWTVLIALTALWTARKWPLALLPLGLPVLQDVMIGNIHLLLGAAIVVGMRFPAIWAFVLLTKVTPGVGLWWFVMRREWRSLAVALGTTALIVAATYLITPETWHAWIDLLRRAGGQEASSLVVRIAVAAGIVTWGAWTSRPWTVPVAAMLALPVVWMDSFAMLLAAVALKVDPPPGTTARRPTERRAVEPMAQPSG